MGTMFDLLMRRHAQKSPHPLYVQNRFAATGCLAWNETASAARLSAGHAEDLVARGGPAARLVVV